ncbi:MAG: LytTR family DNA-binding domain-containing protein [SAR324 cluster bacterium]|nr:LytTR family DNA-binding domain-containing protein [SAR324 cluster bacterium]
MPAVGAAVFFLGLLSNQIPRKKTILGFLPYFVAAAVFTYLGLLLYYFEEITNNDAIAQSLFSVILISAVMQALIYPSKTYDQLINQQAQRIRAKVKNQALVIPTEEGELLLEPASLSCIWVEDHYLHIIHQNGETWAERVIHGKLKAIEERFRPYLIKVSRSALVNPKHSLGFSETHLHQAGMDEGIKIPQSRMAEVTNLINLGQFALNNQG